MQPGIQRIEQNQSVIRKNSRQQTGKRRAKRLLRLVGGLERFRNLIVEGTLEAIGGFLHQPGDRFAELDAAHAARLRSV